MQEKTFWLPIWFRDIIMTVMVHNLHDQIFQLSVSYP